MSSTTTPRVGAGAAEAAAADRWSLRRLLPAGALLGAVTVLAVAVAVAVSPRAATLLADPGTAVRFGLPAVAAVHDLALLLAVGSLALVLVAVPFGGRASARGLQVATAALVTWTVAAIAMLVLTYASVSGTSPASPAFGSQLAGFVGGFELGQSLLAVIVLAGLSATVAAAATGPRSAALAAVPALAALLPLALTGHSGGAEGHETAVTALGLHLLGLAVWVGGLLTLVLLRPVLRGPELVAVVGRFSGLALVAVVLVSASGVLNAATRLGGLADLGSRYGLLVVAKVVLVAVLVGLGWWHRRATVPRLGAGGRLFWRLVGVELLVMASTVGVSVGLTGTAPPVSDTRSPVEWSTGEVLIGFAMPPQPTALRLLTQWRPDLFWVVVVAALAAAYLLGVRRLHARGDRWPLWRTVLWLAGLAVVLLVTGSGLATYGRVLFSAHMVQHMTMSMVAPLLLVPAMPVTLALRALVPRRDGSRGPREWLLWGLHSPVSRFLTHPVPAAVLLTGSLVVFYYSPLFGLALRTHYGHEAMHLHFLLAGYLFVWSLVGTDPGVRATPYPLRLLILFATMAFHAFFFGVALMGSGTVLQPGWFETVAADRGWGASPLADQQYGAGLAWGMGEIPTIVLAVLVAVRWVTDDSREARRRDRKADRDGEADLDAYNRMLARLDGRRGAGG